MELDALGTFFVPEQKSFGIALKNSILQYLRNVWIDEQPCRIDSLELDFFATKPKALEQSGDAKPRIFLIGHLDNVCILHVRGLVELDTMDAVATNFLRKSA